MKDLSALEIPNDGEITIAEVEGRLQCANHEYTTVSTFTTAINNHPKIFISRDLLHPYGSGDEAKALFLPVNEPLLKQFMQIYKEQGFTELLEEATKLGPILLRKGAAFSLKLVNLFRTIRSKLSSNTSCESNLTKIIGISQTRNWQLSPIRCIAWHPFQTKIAIAASDDSVRIYSSDSKLVPLLKCKQQRNVTCLEWRPLSASELAIGCENGIFVWNIDPNSVVTRPSINNATILHRIDHIPVVSLAWSRQGDVLASSAASDSGILIWNVELNETTCLKRPASYGNSLLKWSPSGTKLFSASIGLTFRVWECCLWQTERWNIASGRIQTACWSPCGSVLLFTTTTDCVIYALSFIQHEIVFAADSKNSPNQATAIYDTTKMDIDGALVGGIIKGMEWDPKGYYLAVLFEDTNYIAIFRTLIHPLLQVNPGYVICGGPEEKPTTINFQKNFDEGACLSIGWSSGRLQHFPIIFSLSTTPVSHGHRNLRNLSFYNSHNSQNSSFY